MLGDDTKDTDIKTAIKDLNVLAYGRKKQVLVPLNERADALTEKKRTQAITANAWVRCKRGKV